MYENIRFDGLKMPKDIETRPQFLGASNNFIAPSYVDLRGYSTRPKNQGSAPTCAACSCTSIMESILWRRDDYVTTLDPNECYRYAKQHDGDPNGDGTTLNAAWEYYISKGYFSKDAQIQFIYGGDVVEKVKYGVHKFGVVHVGLNVTSEMNLCNKNKTSITGNGSYYSRGGHAVAIVGYTCDADKTGGSFILQNSWGEEWGLNSFALITFDEFRKEFIYGCVVSHALDGLKMNV